VESTGLQKPEIGVPSSGESHHLPRKGYQQDALFAGNKVELSPVNKVERERGALYALRVLSRIA
jgi:hypothetical protein